MSIIKHNKVNKGINMRKLIVLSFISLDGIMQAPGGPQEDSSGNFNYGGWSATYFDDFIGKIMSEQLNKDFDLVLGRKTYEIFASYWPFHQEEGPSINKAIKYVATRNDHNYTWSNTVVLKGDIVQEIIKIKESNGPDLQVHGSGNLIQTLLKNNLVDELWLKIFPIVLGTGKRLFTETAIASSFTLNLCDSSPSGVIIANYKRSGGIKTGDLTT